MSHTKRFEWSNGQVFAALQAMADVCTPGNRYPVVTSVRAHRNQRKVAEAWADPEKVRLELIVEHGEKRPDGSIRVLSGMDGNAAFADAFNELCAMHGQAVELEILSLAEIEKGYTKDPNTGAKEELGIAPDSIGTLMDLGVVTEDGKPLPDAEEPETDEEAAI